MNNKKLYNEIIERAKMRGLNKKLLDGYFEKHHIIPKCLGGLDDDSNYVLLTAKEHFICHHLLWRSNRNNMNLFWAFKAMAFWKGSNTNKRNDLMLTSKQYEELRKKHNKNISERMSARTVSKQTRQKLKDFNFGKHLTEETKQKISMAHKQIIHTEEWNQKVSAALKGKSKSYEHKEKNRIAHIGKKHSDETNAKKGSKGSTNPSAKKCKINNIEFGCLKDAVKYANEILLIPKKRVYKMFDDINEINFVKC